MEWQAGVSSEMTDVKNVKMYKLCTDVWKSQTILIKINAKQGLSLKVDPPPPFVKKIQIQGLRA